MFRSVLAMPRPEAIFAKSVIHRLKSFLVALPNSTAPDAWRFDFSSYPSGAVIGVPCRQSAIMCMPRPVAARSARRAVGCLLLLLSAGGCFWRHGPVRTSQMQIVAAPAANDNSPTPVEAVMVYDEGLLKTLLAMSASDWFASRDQLRNDFPDGFASRAWEVVPGQRLDLRELPFKKGLALLVFANYRSPGPHRARLDARSTARITLNNRDFTVTEAR
jgi:type VI secretion system protein